jgi:hypothetical protein
MAFEFPGGEVAPGAEIAAWISLQSSRSHDVLASAPIITNNASAS